MRELEAEEIEIVGGGFVSRRGPFLEVDPYPGPGASDSVIANPKPTPPTPATRYEMA